MKINIKKIKKKPKAIILLTVILGIFALLDIFVGLFDIISGITILGISGMIFGLLLISLGITLLISVYWIWNYRRWGYFLAIWVILADLIISSVIFLLKLPDEKLLVGIIIDFCLILGILYVKKKKVEKEKNEIDKQNQS
jgi:inner membrane protein involved in colicin E2 resistance